MIAKLRYLGRALCLMPGEVGQLVHDVCTVSRREQEMEWVEDLDTGEYHREVKTITNKIPLFWYDTDSEDRKVMCSFAGFGPRIIAVLQKKGYTVETQNYVDDGLGEPDIEALRGTIWRARQKEVFAKLLAHERGIVVCPTAWGKCLGKGTPVMLYSGEVKKVEDVEVGDQLMGPDSQPRNVLSLAQGREQLYRVTPTKGDPYVVNESHILSLVISGGDPARCGGVSYQPGDIANVSVRDYLSASNTFRHVAKGWRAPAIDFPSHKEALLIPPYILGVWLGDGTSARAEICSMDEEVIGEWGRYATNIAHRVVVRDELRAPIYAMKPREGHNVLYRLLKHYGLLHNKHVPQSYLTASRDDRMELLAGLIDTDGYLQAETVHDIVFKHKALSQAVVFLARSLGLAAYMRACQKECVNTGKWGTYYRVKISGDTDQIPCRVKRRCARARRQVKDVRRVGLTIEPTGEGEYYGFEIDGDSLFLLGDFTVTHNTFIIKLLAKAYPKAQILITVNSNDIADDIYDALKYDLASQLGRIGKGKSQDDRRVIVCTSQSLHKAPKDVSLILADECHTHMTEGYVKKFNKFRRARLFGFTATPEGRSDGAEGFGEALFGPVIANVNYQESVAGGNIVQLHVRVHRSELGPEVSRIAVKATADRLGIWLNEDRNNLIARVTREVEEEIGDDQQLLIMVDKTEHAYALGQLLPNFAIVTGEPDAARVTAMRRRGSMTDDQEICTVKMRERYKKAFEAHELKRAIATKIWSKGVDFRDLAVLVRADGSGSPIDAGQVPGRLSRLGDKTAKDSGLLIDFLDTFSGNLQGRAQKRLAVYRKNGFRIEMR